MRGNSCSHLQSNDISCTNYIYILLLNLRDSLFMARMSSKSNVSKITFITFSHEAKIQKKFLNHILNILMMLFLGFSDSLKKKTYILHMYTYEYLYI